MLRAEILFPDKTPTNGSINVVKKCQAYEKLLAAIKRKNAMGWCSNSDNIGHELSFLTR